MVAESWRQACARTGDARDQLGTRLALVETVLRYLTAVLATEVAGLDIENDTFEAYQTLLGKLSSNVSWGDWSKAAAELAKEVSVRRDECVAPEFADIFWKSKKRGKPKASAAQDAFRRLIECRNRVVHPENGSVIPNLIEAENYLQATNDNLKEALNALRVLKQYPLYCCTSVRGRQGRPKQARILHLIGTDFDESTVAVRTGFDVPENIPFIVSAAGHALLLSPFVVAGPSAERHEYAIRLLVGENEKTGRLVYTDGIQRGSVPFPVEDEKDWVPVTNLLMREALHARLNNAFDPDELSALVEGSDELIGVSCYTFEGLLGRGASGRVYRSVDAEGRTVAVKCLHSAVVAEPQFRKRLAAEYEVMAKLNHPHIAQVYDFGIDDEAGPYMVLEYIDGLDLSTRVAREPLDPDTAGRIAIDVLKGLAAAHQKGVLHRDVKPGNIMVDGSGHARLLDFGIATAEWLAGLTRTVDAVGTTAFAAPEQLRGHEVNERADIFSVGRTIEFLLEGAVGPKAQSGLVEGLRAVVRRATQPDPIHRWSSALEMIDALKERMETAWDGAPVHTGDLLNQSYRLQELLGAPMPNHWIFRGEEVATEEEVILLLGYGNVDPSLGQRGRDWIQACGADDPVRYRGIQKTGDGLEFGVFHHSDPKVAEVFLGLESLDSFEPFNKYSVADTPHNSILLFEGDLPQPLEGLRRVKPNCDPLEAFLIAEILVYLILLIKSFKVSGNFSLALDYRGPVTVLTKDILDPSEKLIFEKLVKARNDHVHALKYADVNDTISHLRTFLNAIVRHFDLSNWNVLSPILYQANDGHWMVVKNKSANRINALELTTTDVPKALWAQFISIQRRHQRQFETDVLHKVHELFNELNKDVDVKIEYSAHFNGRMLRADAVAYYHEDCLAVVEIKKKLDKVWLRRTEDQVLKYGLAFKSKYVVITDGNDWRWYEVSSDQGLMPLHDKPLPYEKVGRFLLRFEGLAAIHRESEK